MTDMNPSSVRRRISRRRQRGSWLTENIYSLILYAVALLLALGLFALGYDTIRKNQTKQMVQFIIGGVRGLYASNVNYSGLSAAILVNAGEIPAQYVRGTSIETPFGGAVTLGGWDGGWSMGIANDRTDICIALLSQFVSGSGFFDQLTGVATPATVPATLVDGSATATTIVATVASVSTACAGTNRNMVLEFR